MLFSINKLSEFPKEPGVYLMKNTRGDVLYIGKAKNLRSRIKQYFATGGDERAMIPFLIAQVADIDVVIAPTEKDALILENTLIKKHRPKFNALLKDDKTFISLRIDPTAHWPMIRLVRYKGQPKDKALYFGPYPHAHAARETFELVSKLFPLRQCSNAELKRRTRPCLLHGIKRCIAPCVKLCSSKEYETFVQGAVRFLQGHHKEVINSLTEDMLKASDSLEFEKAAALLRTIEHIRSLKPPSSLVTGVSQKSIDVLGLYREHVHVLLVKLLFRDGNLIGSTPYYFHFNAEEDVDLLSSFIVQHYAIDPSPPEEILLQASLPPVVEEILSGHYKKNIHLIHPKIGKKHDLVELAIKNAKSLFIGHHKKEEQIEEILLAMQSVCKLTRYPKRIECFDTSSHGGEAAITSMVAFTDGIFDPKRTRLFKPKDIVPGDDYGALRQALTRRLERAKAEDDLPDLLLIDGGKGHVTTALEVLHLLDIASIDLLGCAKEKGRHDKGLTAERIFMPYNENPLILPLHSPLLFLIQRIRDKAHSVAIQRHLGQRKKTLIDSALTKLPGIGPIKQKKLLTHFRSIQNMKKASQEELQTAGKLSSKDLEVLCAFLATT